VRLLELDNSTTQKVYFEIGQIDKLINDINPLLDLCKIREPDYLEKNGAALILHSFYNGIENIISLIIKNKDSKLPNDSKWHKELLNMAFTKTENRSEIFNEDYKESLSNYLKFRHFVRHSYSFQLEWEEIKPLLFNMNIMWNNIKENIKNFMKNN
jgi:hypothetical protein